MRRCLVVGVICLGVHSSAWAQYSQSVFLELVRDPGRADVPRSARELALAGVPGGSGTADDAVVSPGSLILGTGTDVVVSYGRWFYSRQELVNTPNQLPPRDPTRGLGPRSTTPVGYVAAATRRVRWAAAGFYDGASRQTHAFTTERTTLFSTALFPTIIIESGTGAASLSQSTTRLGGSIAIGSQAKRAAIGLSVQLVRFKYAATAVDTIEVRSSSISNPTLTTFCCVVDQDHVEFRHWASAFAVSGAVTPIRHVTLTGRWRREPTFTAVREVSVTRQSQRESFTQDVRFRMPAAYAVGAIVTAGGSTMMTEVSRELYAGAFSPVMSTTFDPNYICSGIAVLRCAGWNFPYHDTKDTTNVKAALEHALVVGGGRLMLRGGFAFEPAYTLARRADHISTRRTLSLPAPAIVTEFEPPRESSTWLSAGVAYAWRGVEIGAGVGRANHQMRVLADLRILAR